MTILKIITRNHPDTVIISVMLQHFAAEAIEICIGQAVIFQNYTLGFVAKKPGQCLGDRFFTAQIFISI